MLTEQQIRKALAKMQLSKIQSDKDVFWLRSVNNDEIHLINNKLQLKIIPDTISQSTIKNYIPRFL